MNPTAPLADVEPALKLADLLHACARQVARKGDFASLFQKAKLLQAGWNLDDGCLANGPPFAMMENIDMERPVGQQLVYSWEMPPYPNVLIARIPYAVLDSALLMEERGRSAPLVIAENEMPGGAATCFEAVETPGRLIACRDLYLAVAKVNAHDIGAVFFENYSVDVQINKLGRYFQKYHTSAYEMGNFQGSAIAVPEIECDGWRRIMLHRDVDFASNWICREPGSKSDPLHDELPEDGVCRLVFAPVDAKHVEDWLRRDKSLRGPDGGVLASVDAPVAKRVDDSVSTWNCDTSSAARHVEAEIHSGAIEAALGAWTDRFRALMEAREQGWRVAAAKDETKLRDRWRAEQMEGYGE